MGVGRSVALLIIVAPLAAHAAPASTKDSEGTLEISAGIAQVADSNVRYDVPLRAFSLDAGVGKFVSRNVAVTLRASITESLGSDAGAYTAGVIGPNAQLWLGNAWLGGGIGVGFIHGCVGDCMHTAMPGLDVRGGYLFGNHMTLSGELTAIDPFAQGSLETVSLMLGYQML